MLNGTIQCFAAISTSKYSKGVASVLLTTEKERCLSLSRVVESSFAEEKVIMFCEVNSWHYGVVVEDEALELRHKLLDLRFSCSPISGCSSKS